MRGLPQLKNAKPRAPVVVAPRIRICSAVRVRFRADGRADPAPAAVLAALANEATSFELMSELGEVSLVVVSPGSRRGDVAGLLLAAWPGAVVDTVQPTLLAAPCLGVQLLPILEDWLPLAPRKPAEFDFFRSAAHLLAATEDVNACVQLVAQPFRDERWRRRAAQQAAGLTSPETNLGTVVMSLAFGSPGRAPDPPRWLRTAEEATIAKSATPTLLRATVRLAASGPSRIAAARVLTQLVELLRATYGSGLNNFALTSLPSQEQFMHEFNGRIAGMGFVATSEELAPLWHAPPDALRNVPGLWQAGNLVRSPRDARTADVRLGHDPEGHPVFLQARDWNSLLLVGASGGGKSTLGERLALSAIHRGAGEATLWIEPKSTETVSAILERLPEADAGRLVLVDPKREPIVPLNPLQRQPGVSGSQAADGIVASLARVGPDLGHRTDRLLRMAVTATYDGVGASTLVGLYAFLTQPAFRGRVVASLPASDFAAGFWRDEFDGLSMSQRSQWIEPALHRLSPFLADPVVRRFVGTTPGIDLRRLIEAGAIILADFSLGKYGDQNGVVLANLLLSAVGRVVMGRVDGPEESHPRLNLFIDEAHLVNADLSRLLALMRAFNVNITVMGQFLHQFPDDVVESLLGNATSLIAFRLGERDAHLLAERFAPEFSAADLMALDNYHAAARLVVNGKVLRPFTLITEPLEAGRGRAWAEHLRDISLERHGVATRESLPPTPAEARPSVVAVEWESN